MANQANTQTPRSSRAYYIIALSALVLAIGTHFYLTQHHLALKYGQATGSSVCDINATFSCSAAAASKFSELFGVPIALWGAVTNFVLLILALFYPMADEQNKARARGSILLFSGFIAFVSIVMAGISLTQLTQYCPFCIGTYVLSFIAFFGFWKGLSIPSKTAGSFHASPKSLGFSAVGIFLLTFIVNHGMSKGQVGDTKAFDAAINSYVQEWQNAPTLTINPISPLVKGNTDPNAKMKIVEFADFRCSHCKAAAPTLDAFVKSHPGVQLSFQTFPLDGECNTSIQGSNGASCLLARAHYCAQKFDKGWQVHDWIFANQETMFSVEMIRSNLDKMSTELGLDVAKMKECADSDEAKKIIEQQAALGVQVNIRGTPTLFVNGKMLPGGANLSVLQRAYELINAQ